MRIPPAAKLGVLAAGVVVIALLVIGNPLSAPDPAGDSAPSPSPAPPGSQTPPAKPTPTPSGPPAAADTLCGRLDRALIQRTFGAPAVELDPNPMPPEIGLPTYDVCALRVGSGRLRMGVSVLPATKAELSAARKAYEATRGRLEPARPVGLGQGGHATSRSVTFMAGGRLVRISGPPATVAGYVGIARGAVAQVAALPVQPLITRPECDRGTVAASGVLDGPAHARRDFVTPTGVTCVWITTTAALSSSATTGPAAVAAFRAARKAPTAEPVPLGDDGFFDTRTRAVRIRVGAKVAALVPLPAGRADRNDMIAAALRIAPLYTR